MVVPPEILAAIDADPTALEPRRVLGDWYSTQGDPLGELTAVQVALQVEGDNAPPELRAREQELFERHRERFFGPLREPEGKVKWFAGAWRSVGVLDMVPDLTVVLDHPLARWVTELELSQTLPLDRIELPTLRDFTIRTLDLRTQLLPNGRRQPRLSRFCFEGSAVRLTEQPPLGLSELRLKGRPTERAGVHSMPGTESLTQVRWPVLERLSIDAAVRDSTVEALFDADRFPRLTHLRLEVLGPGAWDVLAHVKRPPPLQRLELVDPNFRRPAGVEWVSRAFMLLQGIASLQLVGPALKYEGPGSGVLRSDEHWSIEKNY